MAPDWTAGRRTSNKWPTVDDLSKIKNAASKITVQGARYPEKLEQLTGR